MDDSNTYAKNKTKTDDVTENISKHVHDKRFYAILLLRFISLLLFSSFFNF